MQDKPASRHKMLLFCFICCQQRPCPKSWLSIQCKLFSAQFILFTVMLFQRESFQFCQNFLPHHTYSCIWMDFKYSFLPAYWLCCQTRLYIFGKITFPETNIALHFACWPLKIQGSPICFNILNMHLMSEIRADCWMVKNYQQHGNIALRQIETVMMYIFLKGRIVLHVIKQWYTCIW